MFVSTVPPSRGVKFPAHLWRATLRYVGVGIGRVNAVYPGGAVRILSDGTLKNSVASHRAPIGFAVYDIVGVLVDTARGMASFDVNGEQCGEIAMHDLAPGDGLRPLVYMFSPGDRFSFLRGIPVPPSQGGRGIGDSVYKKVSTRPLPVRARSSLTSPLLGAVDGSGVGLQALAIDSNSDGVWLRLANPNHRWGHAEAWVLLQGADGIPQLSLVPDLDLSDVVVINHISLAVDGTVPSTPVSCNTTPSARISAVGTAAVVPAVGQPASRGTVLGSLSGEHDATQSTASTSVFASPEASTGAAAVAPSRTLRELFQAPEQSGWPRSVAPAVRAAGSVGSDYLAAASAVMSDSLSEASAPASARPWTTMSSSSSDFPDHAVRGPSPRGGDGRGRVSAAATAAGRAYTTQRAPAAHLILAAPDPHALQVGLLPPSQRFEGADEAEVNGTVWIRLHPASQARFCEPSMLHLDAWVAKRKGGTVLVGEATHTPVMQCPDLYDLLTHVPVAVLQQRFFILELFASVCMSVAPLLELQPTRPACETSRTAPSAALAMQCVLRDAIPLLPKERLIRGVLQRTMEAGTRPLVSINRLQIRRGKDGLAGRDGARSVFAQACAELVGAGPGVLLASARVWKVKFVGEGADDAGGGYSESISEMCEELVTGLVALLIRTPNGSNDTGDNRDTFILNPAASQALHLRMFEFLGVLIGIAVRTACPITLPLAPSVWRQLAGLPVRASLCARVSLCVSVYVCLSICLCMRV